jgi:basic membrane protein A
MKKIKILVLFSLMLLLVSCMEQKVSVHFMVLEYNDIMIDSVEVNKGEDFLLPQVEHDWYVFEGWYKEQSYETLVESVNLEEDITLYGKFEPSLSIAVLGNPNDNQYDAIIQKVDEYSVQNNRLYEIYDTSETDPYEPFVTMYAIEDAIQDGAKMIILTSGVYHSEAVYEAQQTYPDIFFVLIGDEPKEYAFYNEPVTLSNTVSTKYPHELSGFMAGYSAVYEGFDNLGYLNVDSYQSIESGVGFLAGAFYAAKQLNVDVTINKTIYKNYYSPSLLLRTRYTQKAIDLGAQLIYTFEDSEYTIIENNVSDTDVKMILAPGSYTNGSESILSLFDLDLATTVESILESYFAGSFKGGSSIHGDIRIDFSNYEDFNETEFMNIKNLIFEGSIEVPTDYASFCDFMETINLEVPSYIDEYLLDSTHTIEDLLG